VLSVYRCVEDSGGFGRPPLSEREEISVDSPPLVEKKTLHLCDLVMDSASGMDDIGEAIRQYAVETSEAGPKEREEPPVYAPVFMTFDERYGEQVEYSSGSVEYGSADFSYFAFQPEYQYTMQESEEPEYEVISYIRDPLIYRPEDSEIEWTVPDKPHYAGTQYTTAMYTP